MQKLRVQNVNEQDATVDLLRELMSCRDGAFFIDCFNEDEVATLQRFALPGDDRR